MRILQIIKSRNYAGSEQYIVTLCKELIEQGHECDVALVTKGKFNQILEKNDITVIPISTGSVLCKQRLYKYALHHHYDIIHTHLTGGARIGIYLARKLNIPCISHLHIYKKARVFSRISTYTKGCLIAVSEHISKFYIYKLKINPQKIHTVVNATKSIKKDTKEIDEKLDTIRSELHLNKKSKFILLAGRLSKGKGQDILINALPTILSVHPEIHLLLAGKGKNGSMIECKLRYMAKKHKIQKNVHFLGFREDIKELMQLSEAVIVPSRNDVMPLVVIEAMATGSCVIASAVGGIPEIITNNKNGVLFKAGDSVDLSKAIIKILNNPAMASSIGTSAQMYSKTFLYAQSMCDKIICIYQHYININHSAA